MTIDGHEFVYVSFHLNRGRQGVAWRQSATYATWPVTCGGGAVDAGSTCFNMLFHRCGSLVGDGHVLVLGKLFCVLSGQVSEEESSPNDRST